MSIRSALEKILPGLFVAGIGWFAAPYVKSKMEGTPLNGVPGILLFWKRTLAQPLPLWVVVAAIGITAVVLTVVLRKRGGSNTKTFLSVVILPTPPPRWSIGAMGTVPYLSVHFHARLAHRADHSLEIVKGYLKGTESVAPFLPLTVAGPYDPSVMVHIGVRPILVKDGQSFTRRVEFVDQFGKKHPTEPITFNPSRPHPHGFGQAGVQINCLICGKSIAMEDLSETAAFPVHKRCVK
jgi:hypothetical protein